MLNEIKCDELILKARKLCKSPSLSYEEIKEVEQKLNVILPNDFKYINDHFDYEYIGIFEMWSFPIGVIEETTYYRNNHNLSNEYILLSADGASMLLLQTISAEESRVIWCNEPDFFNLCDGNGI